MFGALQLEELRSLNVPLTPLHYALLNEDDRALQVLRPEMWGPWEQRRKRAPDTISVLQPESTGT